MKALADFLGRTPFVLLGVLGLFSIVGTFMTLEENIAETLRAWRTVTRPIWEFLFSWPFDLSLPWFLKDYLTLGVIVLGMQMRSTHAAEKKFRRQVKIPWEPEDPFEGDTRGQKFMKKFFAILFLVPMLLFALAIWPLFTYLSRPKNLLSLRPRSQGMLEHQMAVFSQRRYMNLVFWETGVFFLILIALNYTLILFLGWQSVPPQVEIWV